MTPLLLDDGTALIVNRGWISNGGGTEAVPDQSAPPEAVTVTGLVRKTETRGSFGPRDPTTGTLDRTWPGPTSPASTSRSTRTCCPSTCSSRSRIRPITAADPEPVPAPELDEGPHLSYAVQWFSVLDHDRGGLRPDPPRTPAREIERGGARRRARPGRSRRRAGRRRSPARCGSGADTPAARHRPSETHGPHGVSRRRACRCARCGSPARGTRRGAARAC